MSPLAAVGVKAFLVIIPVLTVGQWALRAFWLARHSRTSLGRRRAAMAIILAALALTQCMLLLVYNLNAINGPLPNYWIACLLAAVFESLISTASVLGPMRAVMHWVLYLVM